MRNTLAVVVVVILAIVAGYFILREIVPSSGSDSDLDKVNGTVVISFTDQTAEMKNVTEVAMEVRNVSLYSESRGWVEVGNKDIEYKLLELKEKGESQLYVKAEITADTYTRAKIVLNKVSVETKNAGKKTATMPRRNIEFAEKVVVREKETASVHFDVLADQSLHTTSKGEFIFTPVIKAESRSNASVTVSSDDRVAINGGNIEDTATLGMDIDGSMKAGFKIEASAKLEISGDTILFPGRKDGAATTSTIIKDILDTPADVNLENKTEETVNGVIK